MKPFCTIITLLAVAPILLLSLVESAADPRDVPLPHVNPRRTIERASDVSTGGRSLVSSDEARSNAPGPSSIREPNRSSRGALPTSTGGSATPNRRAARVQSTTNSRVGLPLIASPQQAMACREVSISDSDFVTCLVRKMLSESQRRIFDCTVKSREPEDLGRCVVTATLGGQNIRADDTILNCPEQSRDSCQGTSETRERERADMTLEELARDCASTLTETEVITVSQFAGCLGLEGWQADPDTMLALSCATEVREPLTFAGCVGGAFTLAEIQKCIEEPAPAGRGCFNAGNIVESYLREISEVATSTASQP